jgi:predicted dehydrogenase
MTAPVGLDAYPARDRLQRIAVVGCGARYSSVIGPALARMGIRPVLLVDPVPAARERALASINAPGDVLLAPDADERNLREARVTGVIIASPTGMHYKHARAALEVGAATFVEKPFARTAEEGRLLVDAHVAQCRVAAPRLSISEQRIYRCDLRFIRDLLLAGELGELDRVTYHDSVGRAPQFATSWRNDPQLAGGGVLLDLGYHTAATLHWLLDNGHPANGLVVQGARIRCGSLQVEQEARVVASGATAEVHLTVRLGHRLGVGQEGLVIEGRRGRATLVRDRARGLVSTVSVSRRSRSRTISQAIMTFILDPRFDTESLRDFVTSDRHGGSEDRHMGSEQRPRPGGQLPRHIRTLEFLEQAYRVAQGG